MKLNFSRRSPETSTNIWTIWSDHLKLLLSCHLGKTPITIFDYFHTTVPQDSFTTLTHFWGTFHSPGGLKGSCQTQIKCRNTSPLAGWSNRTQSCRWSAHHRLSAPLIWAPDRIIAATDAWVSLSPPKPTHTHWTLKWIQVAVKTFPSCFASEVEASR